MMKVTGSHIIRIVNTKSSMIMCVLALAYLCLCALSSPVYAANFGAHIFFSCNGGTSPQNNCYACYTGTPFLNATCISGPQSPEVVCGQFGATITIHTSPTCTTPTDGSCGAANNGNDLTAPSTNLCNTGTASAVASSTGGWTWTCAGSGGGTTASCSANLSTAVNGTCGAANNATYSSAPHTASYLCSTGAVSAVSGTNTWSWSCAGSNGGSTASCTATNCAPVAGYVSAITTNTVQITPGVTDSGACTYGCNGVYATTAVPANTNYNGYTVSEIYGTSVRRGGSSEFEFAVTSPSGYAPQAMFSNITIYNGAAVAMAIANSSMIYTTSMSGGTYVTTWTYTTPVPGYCPDCTNAGADLTFTGTSITVQ